jgi:hypothetical protein
MGWTDDKDKGDKECIMNFGGEYCNMEDKDNNQGRYS